MFEKEAEKRLPQAKIDYYNSFQCKPNEVPAIEIVRFGSGYTKGFKDGAEFGYNKANEWQYVSEKGIPKVKGNYHVWLGKYNYALTYFDETKLWIVSDDPVDGWIDLKDVIAWKEIVLPELKESE